jgi:oligoendopeptidase F
VHDERKAGELTVDRLKQIWMEIQKESFGDAIELDESYGVFWTYISHFIHAPFYVYAYAFGDCLVNSLFAKYMEGGIKDFDKKYVELLAAGGSKRYDELLQPFGLNPKDRSFWQSGLDKISELIDSFEKC